MRSVFIATNTSWFSQGNLGKQFLNQIWCSILWEQHDKALCKSPKTLNRFNPALSRPALECSHIKKCSLEINGSDDEKHHKVTLQWDVACCLGLSVLHSQNWLSHFCWPHPKRHRVFQPIILRCYSWWENIPYRLIWWIFYWLLCFSHVEPVHRIFSINYMLTQLKSWSVDRQGVPRLVGALKKNWGSLEVASKGEVCYSKEMPVFYYKVQFFSWKKVEDEEKTCTSLYDGKLTQCPNVTLLSKGRFVAKALKKNPFW